MATIDPTARIGPGAVIGENVSIGPYCVIGPHVRIGIGPRTVLYPFASLGTPPQSVKYRGGPTRLVIGADCDIREGVTVNIGTEDDRGVTEVGDRCWLMVGSHVGHDCKVGNDVIFANNVVLGGHVTIGDFAVFGGQAAVRQFVRVGEGAMVVGLSGVRADVIPFGLVQGPLADLIGLNVVGMLRRGSSKAEIHRLRRAYEAMFFGSGTFRERLDKVAAQSGADPLVAKVIAFIRSGSRPLTMAIRRCFSPFTVGRTQNGSRPIHTTGRRSANSARSAGLRAGKAAAMSFSSARSCVRRSGGSDPTSRRSGCCRESSVSSAAVTITCSRASRRFSKSTGSGSLEHTQSPRKS